MGLIFVDVVEALSWVAGAKERTARTAEVPSIGLAVRLVR